MSSKSQYLLSDIKLGRSRSRIALPFLFAAIVSIGVFKEKYNGRGEAFSVGALDELTLVVCAGTLQPGIQAMQRTVTNAAWRHNLHFIVQVVVDARRVPLIPKTRGERGND